MDPLSNVDRIVLVLRQRLAERARASATHSKSRGGAQEAAPNGLERLQSLAGAGDIDEHQLQRALIEGILDDQFGSTLINEANFQQIINRVLETIQDDTNANKLLRNATSTVIK